MDAQSNCTQLHTCILLHMNSDCAVKHVTLKDMQNSWQIAPICSCIHFMVAPNPCIPTSTA